MFPNTDIGMDRTAVIVLRSSFCPSSETTPKCLRFLLNVSLPCPSLSFCSAAPVPHLATLPPISTIMAMIASVLLEHAHWRYNRCTDLYRDLYASVSPPLLTGMLHI